MSGQRQLELSTKSDESWSQVWSNWFDDVQSVVGETESGSCPVGSTRCEVEVNAEKFNRFIDMQKGCANV